MKTEYKNCVEYTNDLGELHREDGPAIEWANGDKAWFINGKWHREDGPAIEYANGTKSWWKGGKRHREDGPATEWGNGYKGWYLNGKCVWINPDQRHSKKPDNWEKLVLRYRAEKLLDE